MAIHLFVHGKKYKILPLSILICFKTKISGEFTKALLDFTNQSNFPPSKKRQTTNNASSRLTVMVKVERDNFLKIEHLWFTG